MNYVYKCSEIWKKKCRYCEAEFAKSYDYWDVVQKLFYGVEKKKFMENWIVGMAK